MSNFLKIVSLCILSICLVVSGEKIILKVTCVAFRSMILKEKASSPFTLFPVTGKSEITVEIAAPRDGGHSVSVSSWRTVLYQPAIQYVGTRMNIVE